MGKRTDRRPRIRMVLVSFVSERSEEPRRLVVGCGARFFTPLRSVQNDRGEGEGKVGDALGVPRVRPRAPTRGCPYAVGWAYCAMSGA